MLNQPSGSGSPQAGTGSPPASTFRIGDTTNPNYGSLPTQTPPPVQDQMPPSAYDTPAMRGCQDKFTRLQNIPYKLQRDGLFVFWRYEDRPDKKPAKVPYNPLTGLRANVSDPKTACSFAEAMQRLTPEFDGIGILIRGSVHAIDIDNCLNDNGQLSPMAEEIVQVMESYTEVSPSGHGIRIIFTTTPDFKYDKASYYINHQARGLEIYTPDATAKYVSLTGNVLSPSDEVQERTRQVTQVLDKYMRRNVVAADPATVAAAQPQPSANRPALSDDQVIQAIKNSPGGPRFDALYAGDMSSCGNDHSVADITLCNYLAARTKDPEQIDRIFRSSMLMRADKWDRSLGNTTYGRDTIDKAISSALQFAMQRDMQARASVVQQSTVQPDVVIAATDLMHMTLVDLTYYVDGLIPEGTGLLAAPQKSGKSWFALDLARSLADGTKFLGRDTNSCGVLYLALEDSHRRLKSRLGKLLQGEPVPQNLYFATEAPTLADGLLAMLSDQLEKHPDIRFTIIDTLQIIRSVDTSGNYSYSSDYYDVRALKSFGEENHVSFLLVHHTRKNADTSDVFNTISGTMALSGAADYSFVLQKKRAEKNATLHATGRDIADSELIIAMDEATMRWNTLGDAIILREERERKEFLSDPVVQTVYELVEKSTDHTWSGQAADIAAAARTQNRRVGNETAVGCALPKLAEKFQKYLGITHKAYKTNGNAGSRHDFSLCEITTTTNCETPIASEPGCDLAANLPSI